MQNGAQAYGSTPGNAAGLPGEQLEHLQKPRGVFVSGMKLRMNIIPCFFNIFMPWGVFIVCASIMKSRTHYAQPSLAWGLIFAMCVGACCVTFVAVWVRKREPDPSWFTFSSLAVWIAIIVGTYFGNWDYQVYSKAVYEMNDLKVVAHLDTLNERGQNVIDGGIFYFAAGNKINMELSWHFTHGTTYCVAPITGAPGLAPKSGFYDFWAVGTDCCSTQASDFRCGDYANPSARSAYRILDPVAQSYYRLAVEQTETNYGITSAFPIFVTWDRDPLETVNSWEETSLQTYTIALWCYLCWSVLSVAVATLRYAFLGRNHGEVDIHADPEDQEAAWRFARRA